MLSRQMYIRIRVFLLAIPFLSVACISFALAPNLWTWYSPLFGAIAFCAGLLLILPIIPVLVFRWYDPPTSAFMFQTQARLKRSNHAYPKLAYQWVNLSRISPQMCLAVVVAEDFTFPIHYGVIWHSIVAAYEANR